MSLEQLTVSAVTRLYPRDADGSPDFEAIINGEGIALLEMPHPDADGASGQFLECGPDGRPTILVNVKKNITHQRFTIAHELGHYFLKHGDRDRDTRAQLLKRDPIEMSANRFAAELLMPEDKVKFYRRLRYSTSRMAELFAVSEVAMTNRLKNLGYL